MNHFKPFIILLILTTFALNNTKAQYNNSLYFMDRVPQANQLNPALQPVCNFYLSIPGTNVEFNLGNSAVNMRDVLKYDKETDSTYYPDRNENTKNEFLNKLKPTSYIFTDDRIDLFDMGFRIRKTYFSFNISTHVEAYAFIPKDLIKLGLNFNQSSSQLANENFDFSNLGIKAQCYHEIGFGISQEINPNLTFGFRAKYLIGLASVSMTNSNIYFKNEGAFKWDTKSTFNINSSIPGLTVNTTDDGYFDDVTTDFDKYIDSVKFLINPKNSGFAIDLGIIAKPLNNFSISASLVDIGFIHWKNNVNNISQDGQFAFEGVTLDLSDTADMVQTLLDTLGNVYNLKTSQNAYTTSLTGKLYLAAYYQPFKAFGIGALTRFALIQNKIRPQFTFTANLYISKVLELTGSYTMAEGAYNNLGLGMVWKLGPLQWYLMSDRLPLFWDKNVGKDLNIPYVPSYNRTFNVRTGVNLVFGCRRKAKLATKNIPLLDI
jgi:hypothetical protein